MVQTLSIIGAVFAVGGSYVAVDTLRDVLIAKAITMSYATRMAIASAAALGGLAMISNAAASQSRKNTKNQLSKQLMSAEVFDAAAYDYRTERAWDGMLSNAPGDVVVNQVDLFHDKYIIGHDNAHRAAQSWLRKNEKAQFNEIHYMLYEIDSGKWGMEYLALDTMDSEELTFHDWSNQEMMNHGKDNSFEDWVEHEIDSHGNISLQEWGDDEQESHTKRYGTSRPRGAFTARDAEEDDIAYACDRAEMIMQEHIKKGIVKEDEYYTLDSKGNMIETDDDPSGFTETGREIFEMFYSALVEGTDESDICYYCGSVDDVESCWSCDVSKCIECDDDEMRSDHDGHTYCDSCRPNSKQAEGNDEMKVWVVHVFYESDHGLNQSERFTTNTYMFRDLSDAEGWVRQKVVSDDIRRSVDELEGDGVMLHLPRRVNSENNESEIRIYEDTIRRSPDLRQYDAESKRYTRRPIDRFTRKPKAKAGAYRSRGRRSALKSMFGAEEPESDDDDDNRPVPDRDPRRGAPDLWFAEGNSKKTFPPIFKKATTGKIQEWRIRTEKLPDGNWAYISSHGQLGGSMVEGKGTIIKAGKQGRTVEEQANAEAAAKWKKKKETGYFESIDEAKNNVVVLPMTALNFKKRAHDIDFPAIGQPKLDGVRCLARLEADGTVSLTSRKNKLFPGMDHIREELATRLKSLGDSKGSPFPNNIVIDGELYADPKELTFQQSTGVVRRNNKTPEDLEDEKKIKLNVYDCINLDDPDMDFIDRYNLMVDSLSNMDSIAMVDNTTLSDTDDVDPLHDKFVTQGYEGLMIRNVKGPYKLNGKSKHLQKYKSFQDDEFKIVGYDEGKGDYEGTVIWICEMPDGKRFRIKPNGTHEYRSKLFEEADSHIGKEITVRFFELTDGGLPRHPTGGWFRDYEAESFAAESGFIIGNDWINYGKGRWYGSGAEDRARKMFLKEIKKSYPHIPKDKITISVEEFDSGDWRGEAHIDAPISEMNAESFDAEGSKKMWDESSRIMWEQFEVTDTDELVRLDNIFKLGGADADQWEYFMDESGPFIYITKDTRPWALWQPGSTTAAVRFNNRGKIRTMRGITDIKQLYETDYDAYDVYAAEVFESFDFGFIAPPMDVQCDLCNKWRGDADDFNRHIAYDCPATASRRQELITHYQRLGLEAEGAPIADETCRQDHLLCDDCMSVCLDCNPDADAGGDVCRFCTGESIERFDAFSISDRPVSVKFGKGTSGNAKMKAVFTDGSGDTKTTQFGYKGMSDFTKHHDEGRKSSYLARHGAKSSGQKWNDPTTAGSLSRWVLWNKKSLSESKKSFKNKFNLRAEETNARYSVADLGYQESMFITDPGRRAVWDYETDYSVEDAE